MRRIRMFAGGAVMAVVLVVALPAAGASAAKQLVLSQEGTAVPTGGPAVIGVIIANCTVLANGKVTVNEAAKDKIVAGSEPPFSECYESSSTGEITEAQAGANGKITMKGKINITKPGPCTYTFSKWKGVMPVPGDTLFEASTTGKLNKKLSSKTGCEPSITTEYAGGALTTSLVPFEDALKS